MERQEYKQIAIHLIQLIPDKYYGVDYREHNIVLTHKDLRYKNHFRRLEIPFNRDDEEIRARYEETLNVVAGKKFIE